MEIPRSCSDCRDVSVNYFNDWVCTNLLVVIPKDKIFHTLDNCPYLNPKNRLPIHEECDGCDKIDEPVEHGVNFCSIFYSPSDWYRKGSWNCPKDSKIK